MSATEPLVERKGPLATAKATVEMIERTHGESSEAARRGRGLLRQMQEANTNWDFISAEGDLELLRSESATTDPEDTYAEKLPEDLQAPPPEAVGFTLAGLGAHTFPARPAILCRGDTPILRAGHLCQIAATRGVGKTWLLMTLGLVAASGAEAAGLRSPAPCRVLLIDGEMASEEIQARFEKLCAMLNVDVANLPLTVVGADWQEYLPRLDTAEGQGFVERHVERADLILLDNRSCLFNSDAEKDATAWMPAQDWLLSLRRRGKAVVWAHHSNRQGTARGHSKAEDALNLALHLTRPSDYVQDQGARFVVEFSKARGIHGAAAAPFVAALTDEGWTVGSVEASESDGVRAKLREFLTVADGVGERPKTATAAVRAAGVRKQEGLRVWKQMLDAGEITLHVEGGYCLA